MKPGGFSKENLAGLSLVVALHGAALWGLWQHRLPPSPKETMTLFVNFIAPPAPQPAVKPPATRPPVKPGPAPAPRLVAEAPITAASDDVAPPSPPEPAPRIEAPVMPPAAPAPLPAEPVTLGGKLSAACPERRVPAYPPISRRLGEEGTVVVRVELDEQGSVAAAHIATSSGFARLDQAAVGAVRGWRCVPARRAGRPVRAVAMQPFNFALQES